MNPTYKVLLEDADHGSTSNAVQFTQGIGTIIVTGTISGGSHSVIIEASHNNTDFAPIDGLSQISEPKAYTVKLAHGVYIRARIPAGGDQSSLATVVLC